MEYEAIVTPPYEYSPVTERYLSVLFDHLWRIGKEEIERLGIEHPVDYFMELSKAGESGFLVYNDFPVYLTGIHPEEDHYFTYFMATNLFYKHYLNGIRILKKCLDIMETYDIFIYSTVCSSEAVKFYRLLGFRQDSEYEGKTVKGFKLYRYRR